MIFHVSFLIFSTIVWGWLAWMWSYRTTKDVFFKLFLIGITLWGILSLLCLKK